MKIGKAVCCSLFYSYPAFACVEMPMARLSDESYELLSHALRSEHPDLLQDLTIRSVAAYGYSIPDFAYVELSPHRQDDGADIFYDITCDYTQTGEWSCRGLEEKREITVHNPDDTIRLDSRIDANTAVRIVNSIRREIVIDEQGHFVYLKHGVEHVSSDPLDLSYIHVDLNGRLVAVGPAAGSCTSHEIVVKQIECGLDTCDFQVLQNAFRYHL